MPAVLGTAIAALIASIGVPAAAAAAAGTAIASYAIQAALVIGLQLAIGFLSRGQSPLPQPSDSQSEIRQALSPRVRSYGTVRVSGTVWWFRAIAKDLYLGLAINHGRIASFESFHIDENEVSLDGTDLVTTSPYTNQANFIHHRLGATPETKYSEILTGFNVDNVRGDGVASVLAVIRNPSATAEFQNVYPGGRPEIRVTIRASVVWDPREDISLGGTQNRDDPTTWDYSENPVVCLLDYMTSADGFGIPYATKVAPNLAQWIEAANVCDELVPLNDGGFTARYRVAGTYRLTDAPRDVLAKFTSCFDGRVWAKRDGTVGVTAGKFVDPTVTLTDAHITGWSELSRGQDPLKAVIGIRGQFMSPDHDYREHEPEPWPSSDVIVDVEDDRVASLDLLWSPSNSQARRLMKRQFARITAEWHGTIFTNAYGLKAIDERFVRLQIRELDLDTTFEILSFSFDPAAALSCQLEVISVDATIDDWDPSEEGTPEGGVFGFAHGYTKTGTTIDPVGEAGGIPGQVAYIFAVNSSGVPATPGGYQLISSQSPGGGRAAAIFRRPLDGTETPVTVNNVSGAIIVMLMRGMPNPTESLINSSFASAAFDVSSTAAVARPFAAFQFGGAPGDFDVPSWLKMVDNATSVELSNQQTVILRTGSMTAHASIAVFGTDTAPPANIAFSLSFDPGAPVSFNFLGASP